MFITKKKLEMMLANERESIMRQRDQREWEQDIQRDQARRFEQLERRLYELEKKTGIVEERPVCPMAGPTNMRG